MSVLTEKEISEIFIQKAIAFRMMHPMGRMHITLTGIARFVIESEAATDTLYRIASVRYRDYRADFQPDASADAIERDRLLEKIRRFLDARADRRTDVKADLPRIHRREEILPDQFQQSA